MEPLPDDDAAVLFVERARAVAPRVPSGGGGRQICRRLDGLPLAIELAAARVALLEPDELLVRLYRRLPLLASRSRDAQPRQRTLRATIEWSYELLAPDEQDLFRRLAVFAVSFSLEAAERPRSESDSGPQDGPSPGSLGIPLPGSKDWTWGMVGLVGGIRKGGESKAPPLPRPGQRTIDSVAARAFGETPASRLTSVSRAV